eukprot:gene23919-9490_t
MQGVRCSGCSRWFHDTCAPSPVAEAHALGAVFNECYEVKQRCRVFAAVGAAAGSMTRVAPSPVAEAHALGAVFNECYEVKQRCRVFAAVGAAAGSMTRVRPLL